MEKQESKKSIQTIDRSKRGSALELLAPAKNYEIGRAAIDHGADAVYMGAPSFGARVGATNSLQEIEQMVRYAHQYGAKVYATVNTLLYDEEIEEAVRLIQQLYESGVDALIVQDMGLLECDLPPIAIHASTQTHNIDIERIKFWERIGLERVILARETTLAMMEKIGRETDIALEAFVHGALCVSYSGQCYLSQAINGRSGNRGCCSQPCRSSYNLYNERGEMLRKEEHLLSLKDFNATRHLRSMIGAGITSFKIEGRLKDIGYVKNVTAHYRQQIDAILRSEEGYRRASIGSIRYYFTPDIEKTFNRSFTEYFLESRGKMATIDTQKSKGKKIGRVAEVGKGRITIETDKGIEVSAGDGMCYYDAKGRLQGFNVNRVNGRQIEPNNMPEIRIGDTIWRNHDTKFEKLLQGKTAERKIEIALMLEETEDGFRLTAEDEEGITVARSIACVKEEAKDPSKMKIEESLGKLGGTCYYAKKIEDRTTLPYFIPNSRINELRRATIEALTEARIAHHKAQERPYRANAEPYYERAIDYRGNVINSKAEAFYRRHGVEEIEYGMEKTQQYKGKALMTTKYCIRHEIGACLKGKVEEKYQGGLYLENQGKRYRLIFDCRRCEMKVIE